jgi:hypothetical protein
VRVFLGIAAAFGASYAERPRWALAGRRAAPAFLPCSEDIDDPASLVAAQRLDRLASDNRLVTRWGR